MADQQATFSLRVKCKSGQHVVRDLNSSSTCEQLTDSLARVSGIPARSIRVLTGFPPRVKELHDSSQTMDQLGIKSGDTLIVEKQSMKDTMKIKLNLPTITVPQSDVHGTFMKKVVPADNSCLFTSVYFLISGGTLDLSCVSSMRSLIVDAVKADKATYTEAFLGKSNSDYRHWISKGDSWGGAIELSILSAHFGLELAVVDAQTGNIGFFGEDRRYPLRGFLLYSGIHYDPLFLEREREQSCEDAAQTLFSTGDALAHQMALDIGAASMAAREYTNLQNFSLRCLVCNAGVAGQDGAVEHAKKTGHSNFDEIR